MKRKIMILSLAVLAGVMSGCGKKAASIGMIGGGTAEESRSVPGITIDDVDNQEGKKETEGDMDSSQKETPQPDMPGSQIEDQTFDVTLDGWGDVTFAAFRPEDNVTGDGDAGFKLLKDGKSVYDFPGIGEGNRRSGQLFVGVAAVSFKDYNNDGKKDIIIICKYEQENRPGVSFHEVRFYTQTGDKKEFDPDNGLMQEFLQKNHYSGSIQDVMKGIEEFRGNQGTESASQRGEIEKQIRILTDNRSLWANTMDSEGVSYFYTVADLDRNGRLELITSSKQGTGLFTFSNYFEVNESFDGLTEIDKNRQEGSSETDIIAESAPVFYNPQSRVSYYIFDNMNRNGAENYESKSAVSLENGVIVERALAHKRTIPEGQTQKVTCTTAEGKDISETEYNNIADTVYGGLERQNAAFLWNKAESKEELDRLNADMLGEKLLKSYHKFAE